MQINLDVLDEEINAIEQEMEIIIQSLGCMRENYDLPEVLKELQTGWCVAHFRNFTEIKSA